MSEQQSTPWAHGTLGADEVVAHPGLHFWIFWCEVPTLQSHGVLLLHLTRSSSHPPPSTLPPSVALPSGAPANSILYASIGKIPCCSNFQFVSSSQQFTGLCRFDLFAIVCCRWVYANIDTLKTQFESIISNLKQNHTVIKYTFGSQEMNDSQ